MIRTYIRSAVSLIAVAVALSGCSMFHHKDNYYSQAAETRPLEVPPDLDAPPPTNELNVPSGGTAAASTAPVAATSAVSTPPSTVASTGSANVALTGAGLHVADSVDHTYQRVGIALDRAQLGTVSERDESGRSYTLEVNGLRATVPASDAPQEHHWYNRILHPFGGDKNSTASTSEPVSGRLTVKIVADGDGSRVDVQGASNDTSSSEAARRVIDALRDRLS